MEISWEFQDLRFLFATCAHRCTVKCKNCSANSLSGETQTVSQSSVFMKNKIYCSTISAKTFNVSEVECEGLKSASFPVWPLSTTCFKSVFHKETLTSQRLHPFFNQSMVQNQVSHSLIQYKAKLQRRSSLEYFWFMFGLKPCLYPAMQKNSLLFVSLLTQPV